MEAPEAEALRRALAQAVIDAASQLQGEPTALERAGLQLATLVLSQNNPIHPGLRKGDVDHRFSLQPGRHSRAELVARLPLSIEIPPKGRAP
jgi:hypothetical protein